MRFVIDVANDNNPFRHPGLYEHVMPVDACLLQIRNVSLNALHWLTIRENYFTGITLIFSNCPSTRPTQSCFTVLMKQFVSFSNFTNQQKVLKYFNCIYNTRYLFNFHDQFCLLQQPQRYIFLYLLISVFLSDKYQVNISFALESYLLFLRILFAQ